MEKITNYTTERNVTTFGIGETLTTESARLMLTACYTARKAYAIKADKVKRAEVVVYLRKRHAVLSQLAHCINADGSIYFEAVNGEEDARQDALDAMQLSLIPLLENIGNTYSAEIRSKSRNMTSKRIDSALRAAELDALSLDAEEAETLSNESARVMWRYEAETLSNDLAAAIESLQLGDDDAMILDMISGGATTRSVAEILGISHVAVWKRYQKMVSRLRLIMVNE